VSRLSLNALGTSDNPVLAGILMIIVGAVVVLITLALHEAVATHRVREQHAAGQPPEES
jgi:hypothetical protein